MTAMKKSVLYAIVGSLFFSFTFILNRSMSLAGGYYVWSAVLRYVYTLPILAIILIKQHKLKTSLILIREQPLFWFLWSTVGFGIFYLAVSYASAHGESWLTAAAWQTTIVAGAMLAPVFKEKIPIKNISISLVILGGVVFMQYKNIATGNIDGILNIMIPILIAAFAYPLGNRMTMSRCDSDVDTMQRIFAMTICSMPFWMVCGIVSLVQGYVPTTDQHVQSLLVALFSGVIGTYLFFKATDMVKGNQKYLAVVEATQSGEVVFTLIGGVLLLGDAFPDIYGLVGISCIVLGMIGNSIISMKDA